MLFWYRPINAAVSLAFRIEKFSFMILVDHPGRYGTVYVA